MRKKISTVIVILMILAGLVLVLYPTVSDILKNIAYHRAIRDFQNVIEEIDDETYEDVLAAARAYNEQLLAWGSVRVTLSDEELAEYEKQLVTDGTDVIGYVVIPKINVLLPIYHGTSDAVLQNGVGHLEGSSLPVGGEGTHSVLSGHRGLPSAKLFTNIDQLVIGDTFSVRVLREVLTYEIDEIKTVLPSEVNALRIVDGEDYCTLLTCTPYGVNSHRLLVRGHRIPTPPEEDAQAFDESISKQSIIYYLPLFASLAAVAVILFVLIIVVVRRRRKNRGSNIDNRAK